MTDRELLELAAKAAGYDVWTHAAADGLYITNPLRPWNPLEDDGDALRLAVKLQIATDFTSSGVYAGQDPDSDDSDWVHEFNNNDPYAATRRCITKAAAEIGKEML